MICDPTSPRPVSDSRDQPLSLNQLKAAMKNLPTAIYRAKGIFYTQDLPDTPVILQLVGSRTDWSRGEPNTTPQSHSSLILIGRKGHFDAEQLKATLNQKLLCSSL